MVDFTQFINEKKTTTAPSSGTVDFTQFIDKKKKIKHNLWNFQSKIWMIWIPIISG